MNIVQPNYNIVTSPKIINGKTIVCDSITYNEKNIEALVNIITNKKYDKNNLAEEVFNIMLVAIGKSQTWYKKFLSKHRFHNQKKLIVDQLISEFESMAINRHQVRACVVSYVYNQARSKIGIIKSERQIKNFSTKVIPPFIAKTSHVNMMPGDCFFRPIKKGKKKLRGEPDGCMKTLDHSVLTYFRYGEGGGGSQGDRRQSMEQTTASNSDDKYLWVWDGEEVDPVMINALNKYPNAYACETELFDINKFIEKFGRLR